MLDLFLREEVGGEVGGAADVDAVGGGAVGGGGFEVDMGCISTHSPCPSSCSRQSAKLASVVLDFSSPSFPSSIVLIFL